MISLTGCIIYEMCIYAMYLYIHNKQSISTIDQFAAEKKLSPMVEVYSETALQPH